MQPVETVSVETRTVACDGGGALGHPRVFLTIGAEGAVDCPYCGRRYLLDQTAETPAEGA